MKRGMNDPGGQDNVKYRVAVSNIPPTTSLEELDYLLTFMLKTTTIDVQSLRQDDPGKPKRATLFCNSQAEAVKLKAELDKMPYNGYIMSAFLIGYSAPSTDKTLIKSLNWENTRQSRCDTEIQPNNPSGWKLSSQGPSHEFSRSASANRDQTNMFSNFNVGNTQSSEICQPNYGNRDRNEFRTPNYGSQVVSSGSLYFRNQFLKSNPQLNFKHEPNQVSTNEPLNYAHNIEAQIKKFREAHNASEIDFSKFDDQITAKIREIKDSYNKYQLTGHRSHQTDSGNWAPIKDKCDTNFGKRDFQGSNFNQTEKIIRSYSSDLKSDAFCQSNSLKPTFQQPELRVPDCEKPASLLDDLRRKYSNQAKPNFANQGSSIFRHDSLNVNSQTESHGSNFIKNTPFKFSQSNYGKPTSMNNFPDLNVGNDRPNAFAKSDSECWGSFGKSDDSNFAKNQQHLYNRRDPNRKSDVDHERNIPNRGHSEEIRQSNLLNNFIRDQPKDWNFKGNTQREKQGSTQSRDGVPFDQIMKQVEIRKKIMEQQNVSQKMQQKTKSVSTYFDNRAKKNTPPKKNITQQNRNDEFEEASRKLLPGLMGNIVKKVAPSTTNMEQHRKEKPDQISRKSLPVSFGKSIKKVEEKGISKSKNKRFSEKVAPSASKSGGWNASGPPKKPPSDELGQKILIEQAILVVLKQHEDTLEKLRVYKGIWEGCLDIAKGEVGDKMYELIGDSRLTSVEDAIEIYRKSVPQHKDKKIICEARRRLGTRVFDAAPFGRYMDSKEEAELRQVMQIDELKDPYSVISNLADDNCWYVDYQLDKILSKVYKQNILKPDEEDPFKDITTEILEKKVLSGEDMPAVERFIDQHLARLLPKIKDYMMELICTVNDTDWLPPMIEKKVMEIGVSCLPHKKSQREMHHLTMVTKTGDLRPFLKPYQIPALWQLQSSTHSGALLTLSDGMQYEDLLCRNGCIFEGHKVLIYPAEEKIEEMEVDSEKSDDKSHSEESFYDSPGSSSTSGGSSPYYPWDKYSPPSSRPSSPDVVIVDGVEVIEID